jgi:hypothetical protein
MKDPLLYLEAEGFSHLKALEAIQRLFNFIERKYPGCATITSFMLVRECLMELAED